MKKLIFLFIMVLSSLAGYSQSKKISALPTATDLNSSFVPIIQDSSGQYVNRKSNPLYVAGSEFQAQIQNLTGASSFHMNQSGGSSITFGSGTGYNDYSTAGFYPFTKSIEFQVIDDTLGTHIFTIYPTYFISNKDFYLSKPTATNIIADNGLNIAGNGGELNLSADLDGSLTTGGNLFITNSGSPGEYINIYSGNLFPNQTSLFFTPEYGQIVNSTITNKQSGLTVDSTSLQITNLGSNFIVNTDLYNGIGVERLKIDSVGNVSFPNTNRFEVNGKGSEYVYLENFTPTSKGGSIYIDSLITAIGTLGSIFKINTDLYNGTEIERLKIDSLGNFSMPNTKTFSVNSEGHGIVLDEGQFFGYDSVSMLYSGDPATEIAYAITAKDNGNLRVLSGIYDLEVTVETVQARIGSDYSYQSIVGNGGLFLSAPNAVSGDKPSSLFSVHNFTVNTDLKASGTGIERLKIDSVGNFSMLNTKTFNLEAFDPVGFVSMSAGDASDLFSYLELQSEGFNLYNSGNISGGGIFSSNNLGVGVETAIQSYNLNSGRDMIFTMGADPSSTNEIGFEFKATGGNFEVNTSLAGVSLADQRLLIDSVGNFIVAIAGDAGTTGEYLGSDGAGKVIWGTPSDKKLKKDISPIKKASDKVLSLNPVHFTYKGNNQKTVGFIAQEVQEVLPEMVTDKAGTLHLKNTTYLEPYIIATIQEMSEKINDLEKKLAKLEKKSRKHRPRYDRSNQED